MNLTPTLQKRLDAPVKDFEVALRSYVADKLLSNFCDETALKNELENRIKNVGNTGVAFSRKIDSAKKLLRPKDWKSLWENLNFTWKCYKAQKQLGNHDVLVLGDTALMFYIFRDILSDLPLAFKNTEDFLSYLEEYHIVRNSLSHTGSSIISENDARVVINFILSAGEVIAPSYFWFQSFQAIKNDVMQLKKELSGRVLEIDNLEKVPSSQNRIVCREAELSMLFKYVCGWDGVRRALNRKHLVCVSGYGGIGKTSLVTEFLTRLLDEMTSDTYQGFRPSFILFYSAKMQTLTFEHTTGNLYTERTRSQFTGYEELLSSLYQDLGVTGFDDTWSKPGILVIDNLETITPEDRKNIMDFIFYDLPSTVQVIVTTRIPERADENINLSGFLKESGVQFIDKYTEENSIESKLQLKQKQDLVSFSYGNPLVLTLALRRLAAKKTTYQTIINELKHLPNDTRDDTISSFMFQNTIEEVIRNNSDYSELVKTVLVCLSESDESLSSEVLTIALQEEDSSVSKLDIGYVLDLLATYLVVDKTGDSYRINEFAQIFVRVSYTPDYVTKKRWRARLQKANRQINSEKYKIEEFKKLYPDLSEVLTDWQGGDQTGEMAVCRAFALYDDKEKIRRSDMRGDSNIILSLAQDLNDSFKSIFSACDTHPYVYFQRARIFRELQLENRIRDEYNDQIKSDYERCLMLIDESQEFSRIERTKTYPSILWLFSSFLLDNGFISEASNYAGLAVDNFKNLGLTSGNIKDAQAIYAIAEAKLFPNGYDMLHLRNARNVRKELPKAAHCKGAFDEHLKQLDAELNKFTRVK